MITRSEPMTRLSLIAVLALVPLLEAQPVAVEVVPGDSYLAVRLDKGGLFAFAGHQHGILATDWSADVCFDPKQPQSTSVKLTVATPALRIDSPEARRRAGLEPDNGPGDDDVVEIQQKMLAPENLAADGHPVIAFESRSARASRDSRLNLQGSLTIRGQTRQTAFPLDFERHPGGRVTFRGEVKLEQSDYGIKPVSIGGVVKVKDQVTTFFQVAGRLTDRPCQ
jgi:polyisoprenoid-binding protein YceI